MKKSVQVIGVLCAVAALLVGLDALGYSPIGQSSLTASQTSPRFGPPLGHEEAKHRLGTPQPVVLPSTSFRFENFQDDGKTPVRWSPCRPIHYVVRPDNAPTNGPRMIADAFARLATVTGFRFVDDGATDESPLTNRRPYQKKKYGDRWAPVLITWATPDEVPDFGIDIGGEASSQMVSTQSGDLTYITGSVALDPAKLGEETRRYGEPVARSLILHEFGHLFGLAHVSDNAEVMFPRVRLNVTEYQPGDLAGLAVLASGPCQRDI